MRRSQGRWTSAAARRIVQFAGDVRTVESAVGVVAMRFMRDVSCPPTDLEALGQRLKVTSIKAVPGLPIAGELRPNGEGFEIVYSASMSEGRRRFTVAHECGHAVFEQTGANCPRYGRELERICDMLASEFLMPRDIFRQRLVENYLRPPEIFQLAREFKTSVAATAVRCRQFLGTSIFQGHINN